MTLAEFKRAHGKDTRFCYSLKRVNKMLVGKEHPYLTNNPSHYMNEALQPNCVMRNRGIYTLRAVKAGEELTLRYGRDYPRNYLLT